MRTAPSAAFDPGVEDRAAFSGSGTADEEPVFLAKGRRADGVFHQVAVDLHAAVAPIDFQRGPLAQGVVDGLAEQTLGQVASAGFEAKEGVFQRVRIGWLWWARMAKRRFGPALCSRSFASMR